LALVTASIDAGSFTGAAVAGFVSHHLGYPAAFTAIAVLLLLFLTGYAGSEQKVSRHHRALTAEVEETSDPDGISA
jgi:predicted MFS family arabinose efflux permease